MVLVNGLTCLCDTVVAEIDVLASSLNAVIPCIRDRLVALIAFVTHD